MAEPNKQQIGDGHDNYGQAASNAAKAVKNAGKEIAKNAAAKGAEATANAAAATVKAGAEAGKAVAEIASGTAAGGPWGAIIAAAWAMRRTLFKILVCICLVVLFLIVMVASIPDIIGNLLFGTNGTQPDPNVSITSTFDSMADSISVVVDTGYDQAFEKAEKLINDGGYDYDLSIGALVNYGQTSAGYDVAYILAAYSVSMNQQGSNVSDMTAKLGNKSAGMFPVTSKEVTKEVITPVTYYTYEPVSVVVVTKTVQTGTINGKPQYRYEIAPKIYFQRVEEKSSDVAVITDSYKAVDVTLPIYDNGFITGTKKQTYYEYEGIVTLTPTVEIVKYLECTIHPFDNSVINAAFGIDPNAQYNQYGTTYGEVINSMASSLKQTMYGSVSSGSAVPLTDAELIAFLNRQTCSETRKHIVKTGLSLVGKVPYFWGGKSEAGWNDEWNTPKVVTAAGSSTSGTIRPFGLDCSGFSDWTYKTAVGVSLYGGTWSQWDETFPITPAELLPGDLGFLMNEDGQGWNHVLIFAGYGENGERMWVHSSGGEGVIFNTPSYEASLSLRRAKDVNYDAPIAPTT